MGKKREEKERKEDDGGPDAGRTEKEQDPGRKKQGDHDGTSQDPRKSKPERTSFDTIIKAGLEPYYPDLIQWLCGKRPSKVTPLDTHLPVVRDRDADKVLEISFEDRPPFLAHIEFQMESRPDMPVRMAEYLILIHRLRERLKCEKAKFFCAVIYLSPKAFHGDPGGLVLEGESRTRLECTYDVIKLWEMDPAAALEMQTPGLWAFAPFMAGNMEEVALKSKKKICAAPDSVLSPEQKGELSFLMTTLIARALEDPKMRQSLLEKLSQDPDDPYVTFLREQGRKEGKAEGKAEGEAEGKAEGVMEEARRAVLHALECRFGRPSQDLVYRIESISCREKLEGLLGEAILAPGIDAFLHAME
jgi:predicted transposase YdaD